MLHGFRFSLDLGILPPTRKVAIKKLIEEKGGVVGLLNAQTHLLVCSQDRLDYGQGDMQRVARELNVPVVSEPYLQKQIDDDLGLDQTILAMDGNTILNKETQARVDAAQERVISSIKDGVFNVTALCAFFLTDGQRQRLCQPPDIYVPFVLDQYYDQRVARTPALKRMVGGKALDRMREDWSFEYQLSLQTKAQQAEVEQRFQMAQKKVVEMRTRARNAEIQAEEDKIKTKKEAIRRAMEQRKQYERELAEYNRSIAQGKILLDVSDFKNGERFLFMKPLREKALPPDPDESFSDGELEGDLEAYIYKAPPPPQFKGKLPDLKATLLEFEEPKTTPLDYKGAVSTQIVPKKLKQPPPPPKPKTDAGRKLYIGGFSFDDIKQKGEKPEQKDDFYNPYVSSRSYWTQEMVDLAMNSRKDKFIEMLKSFGDVESLQDEQFLTHGFLFVTYRNPVVAHKVHNTLSRKCKRRDIEIEIQKKIEYNFEDHIAQPGSKYYVRWPKHYQKILDSKTPEELEKRREKKCKKKTASQGGVPKTDGGETLAKGFNLSRPKPPPAKYLYKV